MLYLFGSGSWENNRKIVKVGYTNDFESRKQHYRFHNPLGKFLNTREGDEELELKCHLRLQDYKVEFLDEWFYDEPEVFEVFNSTEDEIDDWLWEHRLDCLLYPIIPSPGSLKRTILDKLTKKFKESTINGEKLL